MFLSMRTSLGFTDSQLLGFIGPGAECGVGPRLARGEEVGVRGGARSAGLGRFPRFQTLEGHRTEPGRVQAQRKAQAR